MPKRSLNTDNPPVQKKAKQLSIRAALRDGKLLSGVTREGLQVNLQFLTPYNQASNYATINEGIYGLYQTSLNFQKKYEQPKKGKQPPVLRLKEGHGYADNNAISEALKAFATSQQRLMVKEALSEGTLLSGVVLEGLKATLHLHAAYNHASYNLKINKSLYDLYHATPSFQAKFEIPVQGAHPSVLWLRKDHGYVNGNEILEALKAFASHKEPLKIKEALYEGRLLASVTLEGLQAILHLQAEYNQAGFYNKINHTLYDLYHDTPALQATFEQPRTGNHAPILRLKEGHGYADGHAISEALKAFAPPKKYLMIKAALRKGRLLESVTLEGVQVTLHLQAPYNQKFHYKEINRALYDFYYFSPGFHEKFNRPKKGASIPILWLKEGHGYVNGAEILVDLIKLAGGKIENTSFWQEDEDTLSDNIAEQSNNVLLIEPFPQQTDKLPLLPSESDALLELYEQLFDASCEQDFENNLNYAPLVTPHFNSMAANNSKQEYVEFPEIPIDDFRKSPARG